MLIFNGAQLDEEQSNHTRRQASNGESRSLSIACEPPLLAALFFFTIIRGVNFLERVFVKKMIRQNLSQYNFSLEENEAESIYNTLIDRVQQRRATDDDELYEIIEDEVYAFITNT